VSLSTVKNCWNHAKILPCPVASGPADGAIDELKALLLEFSDPHASEVWTKEPQSDGEDAATACAAREASDEGEADESEQVVPMTLR
jgi:hypothetical protein